MRSFDTKLPIDEALPDLTAALRQHHAAVLVAPPGAGKTTRVPLVLLDEPWTAGRKILVLEPRRLSAAPPRAPPGAPARRGRGCGADGGDARRDCRRHGRPAGALRLEGLAQDPYRGGHRGHLHA